MDKILFYLINTDLSNRAFDAFFPWLSDVFKTKTFLFGLLPLILIATFYVSKWRGLAILAAGAVLTWANDVIVSGLLKPLFYRPRPFDDGLTVILRVGEPASRSFPSGHSADAFFMATFLSLYFPRATWAFLGVAFLIAFSRVYGGVHYPGDVVAGALFGSVFAFVIVRASRFLRTSTYPADSPKGPPS